MKMPRFVFLPYWSKITNNQSEWNRDVSGFSVSRRRFVLTRLSELQMSDLSLFVFICGEKTTGSDVSETTHSTLMSEATNTSQ